MTMRNVQELYPLSPLQEGMLLRRLLQPEDDVYLRQTHGRLDGALDVAAFVAAWRHVVERHDVLRTGFLWEGLERPLQVVRRLCEVDFEQADWRHLDADERRRRFADYLESDRRRGFDLTRPPLLRLALFREAEAGHRFVLTVHHLVLDAWSRGLVLADVFAAYAALRAGRAPELPPAPPFRRYVGWLERQDGRRVEAFWRDEMAGLPAPVPFPLASGDGVESAAPVASGDRAEIALSAAAGAALERLCQRHHLTLGTVVHGAWGLLLSRYAARRQVVVGSVVSGRPPELAGIERMVGMLINTLPLRLDVDPAAPVAGWLGELQLRLAALRRFQHSPLASVQRWSGAGPDRPLFDTVVVVENLPSFGSGFDSLRVSEIEVRDTTEYAVTLYVLPGERPSLRLLTRGAPPPTAARLLAQLAEVLAGFAVAPQGRLADVAVLPPAERHRQQVEWNDTPAAGGGPALLHRAVSASAAERPDAVAVESAAGALTYGELVRRARRLAGRLAAAGVRRGDRVALLAERTPDLLVALLGVLESGAAFVPLDPAFPAARLRLMVEDSGARVVLAAPHRLAACEGWGARALALAEAAGDGIEAPAAAGSAAAEPVVGGLCGDDLAYVLYTSGSTGRPKGVQIGHRAVLNFLRSMRLRPGLDRRDVLAAVTTISFDISILELFGPLLAGGRVLLLDRATVGDGERLLAALQRGGASVLQATPVTWRLLLEAGWEGDPPLKALCGGEALPASLAAAVAARAGELWNMFGPTETTVWSTTARLAGGDEVTLGRPIAATRVYVVDAALRPLPAGAVGELLIGGAGLARGYLGRAATTAERFVPDPAAGAGGGEPGGRLYRTGDLARFDVAGRLHFLGRLDQQVKVRGHRIEPGEVEAVLEADPTVSQAVVVVGAGGGGATLVAYLVAADPASPPAPRRLRDLLGERLPPYMVPGAFVLLDAMPLTPNGKVDRRALPEPGRDDLRHRYEPPATPTEERLAAVWAQVLDVERVGARDDFFELGGHSLMATRVVARLRRTLAVDVPLAVLLANPTVAALAAWIDRARQDGLGLSRPPLEAAPAGAPPVVSFAQQRLWFLDELEPGNPFYNLPTAVTLDGPLDVAALARALSEVVRRHEVLRTRFAAPDGEPRPQLAPSAPLPLPVVDLGGLPEDAARRAESAARRSEEVRPFDLARGPLLRAVLWRRGAQRHLLSVVLHHVAGDGWSLGVLVNETTAHYRDLAAGRSPALAEPPLQYGDYAHWERRWLEGEVLARLLADAGEALEGATEPLELPADRPRPAAQSHRGGVRRRHLAAPETAALRSLARQRGTTLFAVLMASLEVLLHRYTRRRAFSVGFPVAHRTEVELEGLIGLFVNTLVVAAEVRSEEPFGGLLGRVDERLLAAQARQDLPFERLVAELAPERHLSRSPLFQVLLVLQNMPRGTVEIPGLEVAAAPPERRVARFDWTVFVHEEAAGGLELELEYSSDLFDATTAERALRHLATLLTAVAGHPGRAVGELPLLDPHERHQVEREWGGGGAAAAFRGGVLARFAAQAAARPQAIAVELEDERLTYGELSRHAARLAGELHRRGAGRGDVVAVQVERSPALAVAVLGALAAGCAYLPLDPAHPPRRRAFLLADAAVRCAVVDATSAEDPLLTGYEAVRLDVTGGLDGLEGGGTAAPARQPSWAAHRHDLAYVLYTSGSTGRPKGVAMSHGALDNLIAWQLRRSPVSAGGRTLQFASPTFDVSFQELFATWCAGGTLVLVGDELRRDLPHLLARMESDVDRAFLPVVAFQRLCEIAREQGRPPQRLREVVTAGEPLRITPAVAWLFGGLPDCRLDNQYGPTEAHVVSAHRLAGEVGAWPLLPPIGRPLPGVSLHVVDAALAAAPAGVAGELWIGGAAPARGYLGRPALTAQRFVPDPFSAVAGARAYRTGDLARHRADGSLEFLGRIDHQVKVRGFRVELGEVESLLERHPGVARAVAVVRPRQGVHELAAYVVPAAGAEIGADALHDALAAELPAPSVPTSWCFLAELPLLPSGKVDRRSLPEPEPLRSAGAGGGRNPVEETLLGLWEEVLGRRGVARDDDFFRLGGHSLSATRLMSRLRSAFAVDLPLRRLFEHPTVASLAPHVEAALRQGGGEEMAPIVRRPRGDGLPLSFAQQRLWFLEQLEPGTAAYHLAAVADLRGELSVPALEAVFDEVRRRHEALRTAIHDADGRPLQVAVDAAPEPLAVTDLSALPAAAGEREAERLAAESARRPFDLAAGRLLRLRLLRRAAGEHTLVATFHHIAADAWSLGILRREVATLYRAFRGGLPSPLPELPVQYADFAGWQRERVQGEVLATHLEHWRRELADMQVLELPTDLPRGDTGRHRGGRLVRDLPEPLAAALRQLGRSRSVTPFMVVLAAYAVLLGRFAGAEDVAVGADIANRNRHEVEGLIGFFVNMLVLRTDLRGNPPFGELLERVRATTLGAYAHQDLPFERLVEELRPERTDSHSPLFRVVFNFDNATATAAEGAEDLLGLAMELRERERAAVRFDLALLMRDSGSALSAVWLYDADLFERGTVERLHRRFATILADACADPQQRLSRLGRVGAGEDDAASRSARQRRGLLAARPKPVTLETNPADAT